MNTRMFLELVKKVKIGKVLPDAIYVHESALSELPPALKEYIESVTDTIANDFTSWNIVKIFKRDFKISLLNYPRFYEDSYPALAASLTIDLQTFIRRTTRYNKSNNPPILHRKECFILRNNPYYEYFCQLTAEGELAGLYRNTKIIGFQKNWQKLIAEKGYFIEKGRIIKTKALSA